MQLLKNGVAMFSLVVKAHLKPVTVTRAQQAWKPGIYIFGLVEQETSIAMSGEALVRASLGQRKETTRICVSNG